MSSPTARSLEFLRREGYTAHVVEQTVHARRSNGEALVFKRDCFGFDILAVRPDVPGAMGIQACAATDHAKRRAKVLANPQAKEWVRALNRLEIWSWRLGGPRGARKTWKLRCDPVRFEEFLPNQPAEQPREALT